MEKTNKHFIIKGFKFIGIAIPLMFAGPIVINSSFNNKTNPLFYMVLSIGITICVLSMWIFFKGIQNIIKGLFGY